MNLEKGDGIVFLIQMALPFVKSIAPKIASTIGLAGLSIGISRGINKALKKDHIIKLSDKQLDDINKNLEKINKMNVFDKKYIKSKRIRNIFIFITNVSIYYNNSSYSQEKRKRCLQRK